MDDKPLGLWSATCLVVASMIGAGVYLTSGFSVFYLESRELVLVAWGVGGLIAVLGAVCYGALARHIAESGGEYLFLSRTVHPAAGFVAGWVSLLAGFTGAVAFAARVLEEYLLPDAIRPDWLPSKTLAITVVAVCGILHAFNVGRGAKTQNSVVVLKLLLLTAFIMIAFGHHAVSGWPGLTGSPSNDVIVNRSLAAAFASSLVFITFSYSGYNAAVYVAGEIRDPQRNVPLAMVAATLTVLVLYLLLNTVFLYAPPLERLLGAEPVPDIAAVAAHSIGGDRLSMGIRAIIVLGLLTSVSGNVQAGPRVYAKMSEDGVFPSLFGFRGGAPRAAIFLQCAISIVVIYFSTLEGLLEYLAFTLSLSTAGTVACLFLLRKRQTAGRVTTSAWFLIIPAIYVLAIVGLAIVAAWGDKHQLTGTAVTVVTGLVAYWLLRIASRRRWVRR